MHGRGHRGGRSQPPQPPFPPYPPYPAFPPFPPYPPYPPPAVVRPGGPGPGQSGGGGAPAPPAASSSTSSSAGTSSSSSVNLVSGFNITAVPLTPVAGYHHGVGLQTASRMVVNPASVPGTGPLTFWNANVQVHALLYSLNANVVPNWFGVAVPNGVTDFSRVNIFFHPTPAQAGYQDSNYPLGTVTDFSAIGLWPMLFYYMELLGYQVDAARQIGANPNQIVIMPFLTEAALDTGIFPANWHGIVTDLLSLARAAVGASGGPIIPSAVVVSSFSAGLMYSSAFRQKAGGLAPLLARIWDIDGFPKATLSYLLTGPGVLKYDQANEPSSIHLPAGRWTNYTNNQPLPSVPPYPTGTDTMYYHHLIRDFMFLHAATTWT